jgi:hypothetical protein
MQCPPVRRSRRAVRRAIHGRLGQAQGLKNKLTSNAQAIDKPIAALLGDLKQRGLL